MSMIEVRFSSLLVLHIAVAHIEAGWGGEGGGPCPTPKYFPKIIIITSNKD